MVDAAQVAIHAVSRGHRDENGQVNALKLRKTWKEYADMAGIEVEEDEAIKQAEKDRALKAIHAEFGYDD